jgi:2-dehydropantoate 2-reductase
MNIALVGCGGNGGVIAAALALQRHMPVCIDTNGKIVETINENGLRLHGKMGERTVQVRAYTSYHDTPGSYDAIILGVKSNVLERVFTEAKKHLCDNGIIVTIQNGLEVLELAGAYPDTRVVAGAVGYNAQHEDIGHINVATNGGITLAPLGSATRDDVFMLKGLLAPVIPVDLRENAAGILWSKLLIVCGVTGLGGVAGLRVGKLLSSRYARRLFYGMVTEGSLLAGKLGIRLVKLRDGINPERFGNHSRGLPLPVRWFLLKLTGFKYGALKSGIQVDLERGLETEVQFINGAILREGRRIGFETPINRLVVDMVREIEEGKRKMNPGNLEELWNRVQEMSPAKQEK